MSRALRVPESSLVESRDLSVMMERRRRGPEGYWALNISVDACCSVHHEHLNAAGTALFDQAPEPPTVYVEHHPRLLPRGPLRAVPRNLIQCALEVAQPGVDLHLNLGGNVDASVAQDDRERSSHQTSRPRPRLHSELRLNPFGRAGSAGLSPRLHGQDLGWACSTAELRAASARARSADSAARPPWG